MSINKFFIRAISIPLALMVIIFSLSNRKIVSIDFWPIPKVYEVPLFSVIIASVILGVIFGSLISWIVKNTKD